MAQETSLVQCPYKMQINIDFMKILSHKEAYGKGWKPLVRPAPKYWDELETRKVKAYTTQKF